MNRTEQNEFIAKNIALLNCEFDRKKIISAIFPTVLQANLPINIPSDGTIHHTNFKFQIDGTASIDHEIVRFYDALENAKLTAGMLQLYLEFASALEQWYKPRDVTDSEVFAYYARSRYYFYDLFPFLYYIITGNREVNCNDCHKDYFNVEVIGGKGDFQDPEGWKATLKDEGFEGITIRRYKTNSHVVIKGITPAMLGRLAELNTIKEKVKQFK